MIARDWLMVGSLPWRSREEELEAEVAELHQLNETLVGYVRRLEARKATLNARVWRLIAWARRPHAGGAPRTADDEASDRTQRRRAKEVADWKAAQEIAAAKEARLRPFSRPHHTLKFFIRWRP